MRTPSIPITLAVCLLLFAVGLAVRSSEAAADEPELHEYFDPAKAQVPGSSPPSDSGVEYEGLNVPPPPNSPTPIGDEPTYDEQGGQRTDTDGQLPNQNGPSSKSSGLALDDDTDKEGMLEYFAVFNPSVVPFKRGGVLDQVVVNKDGKYLMVLDDQTLREVEVVQEGLGATKVGRQRFWGSLLLDAKAGVPISIPSVAADARILEVVQPEGVHFEFFEDGAQNMFVTSNVGGPMRLNFVTDAGVGYFGLVRVPPGYLVSDAKRYAKVGRFPREARNSARKVAKAIGVSKDDDLAVALPKLIAYFRSFETIALDPAASVGDRYLDVALSKRGVCRHRTFAFIVTAHYLGIPARYVFNEAHAFIEVFVPENGWVRVDLGGGAEGLTVHDSEAKVQHEPEPASDSAEGSEAGDAAEGGDAGVDGEVPGGFDSIQGMPQTAEELLAGGDVRGEPDAEPVDGAGGAGELEEGLVSEPVGSKGAPAERGAAGGSAPVLARVPTQVDLESPTEALRGQSLHLVGRMTIDGKRPAASREIHIVLEDAASSKVVPLGSVVTDEAGRFELDVELPQTLPVGTWDLYATFGGDDRLQSSRSP